MVDQERLETSPVNNEVLDTPSADEAQDEGPIEGDGSAPTGGDQPPVGVSLRAPSCSNFERIA
jgi:hypothetical protein